VLSFLTQLQLILILSKISTEQSIVLLLCQSLTPSPYYFEFFVWIKKVTNIVAHFKSNERLWIWWNLSISIYAFWFRSVWFLEHPWTQRPHSPQSPQNPQNTRTHHSPHTFHTRRAHRNAWAVQTRIWAGQTSIMLPEWMCPPATSMAIQLEIISQISICGCCIANAEH